MAAAGPSPQEQALTGRDPRLDAYVVALIWRAPGRGVGKLRDRPSAKMFGELLADVDTSVRAEAALALAGIGDRGYLKLLTSRMATWMFLDPRVYIALGALGGDAQLTQLSELTKSQNWNEQFYSMEGLSRMKLHAAADRLIEIWSDPESQFQAHAADCLVRMGKVAAVRVARLMNSGDAAVRLRAVYLLSRIDIAEAASALRVALADKDERVRHLAKMALGRRGARAPSSSPGCKTPGPRR